MFELQFIKKMGLFSQKSMPSQKIGMAGLAEEWLNHIRPTVKPSTLQKYEGALRRHILPRLGERELTDISRAELTQLGQTCVSNGLCEKTVNDMLGVIRMMFRYAAREYEVALPAVPFLRQPPTETRVLTLQEEQQLLQYIIQDMDLYRFGILLTLYTGLRIGELCALQWQDVTAASIKVSKTLQRLTVQPGETRLWVGEPKSMNSYREIPLPDCIQQYVTRFRQETGWVLQTKNGTPTEPRTMQAKFSQIAGQCGFRDVTFHTLRHPYVKPKTKKFAYSSQFSFRPRNCSLSSLSAAAKNACSFSFSSGNRHPKVLPPILQ